MIIATRLLYGVLIALGEMCDNMLQLMRFSVYFEGILNTNNGYFHIKIMIISSTHARRLVDMFPRSCPLKSVSSLIMEASYVCFFCMLYRGPRSVSLHTILGPPAHFLDLLYAWGPLRSVSSHTIWGPLSDQCHCLLYASSPLRSVSLHAIARGPPRISFFIKYMGAPS